MKKCLLIFGLASGFLSNAQITVTEGFEGSGFTQLTPQGWSSKYLNASQAYVLNSSPTYGGNSNTIIPCSGSKLAYYTLSNTRLAWVLQYDSPIKSNGKDLSYSLKYTANGFSNTGDVNGVFKVEYSTNGTTWTQLRSSVTLSQANGTQIPCAILSGTINGTDLPTGSSFSLRMTTDNPTGANYYMALDDIVLSQVPTAAPTCSSVVLPLNGAVDQAIQLPITWGTSTGATNYKINIGTTSGGTDVLNNYSVGNNANYYNSTNYLYNTTYYVTVFAENSFGTASGCTQSTFTTKKIPAPSSFTPANTRFAIPVDQTFSWSTSSTTPTGVVDALGYKFSLGTTSAANDVLDMVDVGNVLSYKPQQNLMPGTQYYYKITSYTANTSTTSDVIAFSTLCNAVANVTYSEDFNGTTGTIPPICSYVENISGYAGINWASTGANTTYGITSRALRVVTSNATGINSWFYTQGINLEAGKTYILTFDYSGGAAGKTEKLTVKYGSAYESGSMANLIVDYPAIIGGKTTPSSSSTEFTPTVSGVYYIGFNAHSDPSQSLLYLDNIKVAEKATLEVQDISKGKLAVSPNPFTDVIHLANNTDIKSIDVIDFTGRKLKTINKVNNEVNLSSLEKGIYLLKINYNDGSTQSTKIIKK